MLTISIWQPTMLNKTDDFLHDPTIPMLDITIANIPKTTQDAANPTSIS